MSLLAATVAAAAISGSLELHTQIVRDHFLQIFLVARGSTPVLVTPRTTLGCYIEVELQDPSGAGIGHLGPRASCPTPRESEFRLVGNSTDFGSELFGVEIDILASGRVRLVSADGEVGELDSGREYLLVVTYHNDDATFLTARSKSKLHRRYGQFSVPVVNLRSEPISFRRRT